MILICVFFGIATVRSSIVCVFVDVLYSIDAGETEMGDLWGSQARQFS